MSDYKHHCVVDANGFYKTLVISFLTPRPDGTEVWEVYHHVVADGERLIDTQQPTTRPHAGAPGLVRPRWDDGAQAWVEGAAAEELAAWEVEHPAPPPAPMDALTMTELAVAELAQTVEDNHTANQLAVAELAEAVLGGNA